MTRPDDAALVYTELEPCATVEGICRMQDNCKQIKVVIGEAATQSTRRIADCTSRNFRPNLYAMGAPTQYSLADEVELLMKHVEAL